MDEIHPTLRAHICLPSQHLNSVPKCLCRSLIIRHTLPSFRKHQWIKMLRKDRSVVVDHRPHRPDHAPESRILYRRRKVESLIHYAFFRQLRCVTSRQEREFGRRKSRPNDVQERKTLALVKLEACVKRLSCLENPMARKMGKPVVSEVLQNSRRRRLFLRSAWSLSC
jgi:hypothetical protein